MASQPRSLIYCWTENNSHTLQILRSLMFYLWKRTLGIMARKTNCNKGAVPRNASEMQGYQKEIIPKYRCVCVVRTVMGAYPASFYCSYMLGNLQSPSGKSTSVGGLDCNNSFQTCQRHTCQMQICISENYVCE